MIILITAQHFSANRVLQKQSVFCVISDLAQVIQVNSVLFSALIILKAPIWLLAVSHHSLLKYSIQTPFHPSSNAASPFPCLAAVQVQLSRYGSLGCSHTCWQHTSPQPHSPAHQHIPAQRRWLKLKRGWLFSLCQQKATHTTHRLAQYRQPGKLSWFCPLSWFLLLSLKIQIPEMF